MTHFEAGMTVELRGQWNEYLVLKVEERFAKLKCTMFVRPEDLGDGIMCTGPDEEIWVAQYHATGFVPSI